VSVEPGQQLLHYRLVEKIGEGGMGVVWKATDTTLDREVAIKILPDAFADDQDRLARFEREAKLLATLNHPNIAGIYGLHTAGATRFLAMELVEGEDLAERLKRGPLPLDEAMDVARRVAQALESAHEAGVIHRDLKPANVKVGAGGSVKVLDFGLAKALEPASVSGSLDPMASPTVTSAGTIAGVILGTAAYMSPEQARGKPLDRRTDLWSFGCVLYEMLTGTLAFSGETITDVLSAVISREPDRDALPQSSPPSLRRLIDRCLRKEAQNRLADASTARIEIDDALRELRAPATDPSASAATATPARSRTAWLPWSVAVLGVVAAVVFGITTLNIKDTRDTAPSVTGIEALTDRLGPEFMPAISPDGRSLAYVARDGENADTDIFLVRVGGANPINLTADHDGWDVSPTFSPDGELIAFDSEREGGGIFVMGATGESPRRVAPEGSHPDWSPDGTRIVAATEQVANPYSRNTESRIFVIDVKSGKTRELPIIQDGVGPRWSPDGRRILYWNEIEGQRDLWTIPVEGGGPTALTQDIHTDWEPLWGEDGRAVYFHSDRGGGADLWRIPVDPASGEPTGEPTPLTIGVTPAWESSISVDGSRLVVAMRSGGARLQAYPFDPDRLQAGVPETLLESNDPLVQAHLSDDGKKIAFRTSRPRESITTLDLGTGQQRRLTDDPFRNRGPTISPDGEWIGIYSNRGGPYQVWLMRPEGTDLHRIVEASSSAPYWSPDGTMLSVSVSTGGRREASQILRRDPEATSDRPVWTEVGEPILNFSAVGWSPDGRLLVGSFGYPPRYLVYDIAAGEVLDASSPPTRSSYKLAWFPDSERIVYWDRGTQHYLVWNWRTGDVTPLRGVNRIAGDAMISPDGQTLYVMEHQVDGEIWMLTLDRTDAAD
jgi:serine/threonine protein kinase/Tol biopolymer transport system component